jgi:hypothetical protein
MIKKLSPETDHEKFKMIKKELGLKNEDIANIVKQSVQNIKQQSAPKKPLGKIPLIIIWFYENYLQEKKKKIRDEDYFIINFLSWVDANCELNKFSTYEYRGREKSYREILKIYREKLNKL